MAIIALTSLAATLPPAGSEGGPRLARAEEYHCISEASPVDSGRFRASWFVVQSRSGIPDTNEVVPEPAEGAKVPAPPTIDADQLDGGANTTIINNLPYAQRLCEQGYSKKVPANWFTNIKQRWVAGSYLDEAFRRNVNL